MDVCMDGWMEVWVCDERTRESVCVVLRGPYHGMRSERKQTLGIHYPLTPKTICLAKWTRV